LKVALALKVPRLEPETLLGPLVRVAASFGLLDQWAHRHYGKRQQRIPYALPLLAVPLLTNEPLPQPESVPSVHVPPFVSLPVQHAPA